MAFFRNLLKFFKVLSSRYLLFFILVVLQVLVLQLIIIYVRDSYWWIRIIVYAIDILLFFHIMNTKESPEFKIPWIILFLIFPITGIIIWLFFANHGLRKRHSKRIKRINEALKPYFLINEDKKEDIDFVRGFDYLERITNFKSYSNSNIKYFSSGEEYFEDMINEMSSAKEFIFIEFFIVNRGKLWDRIHEILKQKAASGVDVRILLDDVGCAGNMNHIYMQKLRKEGIKVQSFNKVVPIMSGIYNNRDHRKIVVIDHIAAYTGGCNLADEYVNLKERFGHWKDTGVKVRGEAINSFIALFLHLYDLVSKSVSDYNSLLSYEYEKYNQNGIIMPFGDAPKPFINELIGEGNYLNMINSAKKSILISTPYLIPTHSLVQALRNASLRGVDVKIMLPGIPDKRIPYYLAKSYFRYLTEASVKIYIYKKGFNHSKCVVVDDILAFNGTINFDYRSLVHHFECGVLMYNTPCIKDMVDDFNKTFEECVLVKNPKKPIGLVISLINIIAPML